MLIQNKVLSIKCAWFAIFFSFTLVAYSQSGLATTDTLAARITTHAVNIPPLEVYINTSKGIYETMEDCWFKAYVLDAHMHTPIDLDKTLYVQLMNEANDSVVWKEKYQIINGFAEGHLYIPDSLPEGIYLLAAFSSHSYFNNQPRFNAFRKLRIIRNIRSLEKKSTAYTGADLLAPDPVQLNFFAEGGHLVEGLMNKVAFKAVNNKGIPLSVSGTLLQDNVPVLAFTSLHDGMGSFLLQPEPGKKYRVRLTHPLVDSVYTLPAAVSGGMVMHLLRQENDSLIFRISQRDGGASRRIYLRMQLRGMVQLVATGTVKDSLLVKVSVKEMPQGIAEVTLFDEALQPVAERLVYVNAAQGLHIATSLSKTNYGNREKVQVTIKTTGSEGKPVAAHVGLTVYDRYYRQEEDTKDILTHYYLNTQLRGRIYNPQYYFNDTARNRKAATDLLLLTQGWRSYTWQEDNMKASIPDNRDLLPDMLSVQSTIPEKKKQAQSSSQVLLVFAQQENNGRMVVSDSLGRFMLTPEDMMLGRRVYIKHLGKEEYNITVDDPFKMIAAGNRQYNYPLAYQLPKAKDRVDTAMSSIMQGVKNLQEVVVTARTNSVGFRDKYLGRMDSLARFERNTDYVAACGWLNCPAEGNGTKPLEGKVYSVLTDKKRNSVTSHPFYFGRDDFKEITYHYPKFTEEELLKKYKLTRVEGYYPARKFYEPNYDQQQETGADVRNTLAWQPNIITNENGEATITFFCSDINSSFIGIAEAVSADGLLGRSTFSFTVR